MATKLVQIEDDLEIRQRLDAERARLRKIAGLDQPNHFHRPVERAFTAEERSKVTILFGGFTWKHEDLIRAVFQGCGYRCEKLPVPARTDRSRRALSCHRSRVWPDPPMTFCRVGLRRPVWTKLHHKRVGLFGSVSHSLVSYRGRRESNAEQRQVGRIRRRAAVLSRITSHLADAAEDECSLVVSIQAAPRAAPARAPWRLDGDERAAAFFMQVRVDMIPSTLAQRMRP